MTFLDKLTCRVSTRDGEVPEGGKEREERMEKERYMKEGRKRGWEKVRKRRSEVRQKEKKT